MRKKGVIMCYSIERNRKLNEWKWSGKGRFIV
jgi:hypothetical protein